MTLEQGYDFLNFWINKYMGSYYSPPELDLIVDRAQMSIFSQIAPKYATSQRIQDALAPFVEEYEFSTGSTVSGIITIPDEDYIRLLSLRVEYSISHRTLYEDAPIVNRDEVAKRLNSQVDPVAVTSPIAEMIGTRSIRLWPREPNTGVASYLRRPAAPVFSYTVISGRVIVYDNSTSTNLEWPEDFQNTIYIKALEILGINLSAQDLAQYAMERGAQNFMNQNNT